jgi:acetylglutamate kinase
MMSNTHGERILPTVCVKIGGRALEQQTGVRSLAREISRLLASYRCIVIHGGGAEVTRISGLFGLTPAFSDGVRLTTAEEMGIVDMVLAGSINTSLVRAIGVRAVGLTGCDGGIFTGERIAAESHTGRVVETRPELLRELTGAGWVPIISSVSTTAEGTPLNINADDAALAVARSIGAEYLVFVSDIPGIMDSGRVIDTITPDEAEAAIASGVITGGMIPKVRASAAALAAGVGRITIGSYDTDGDLAGFLEGRRGTSIIPQKR